MASWVMARNCTIYQTSRAFRLEVGVENVEISALALGAGVERDFERAPGPGAGFENVNPRRAPPLAPWPYRALPVR